MAELKSDDVLLKFDEAPTNRRSVGPLLITFQLKETPSRLPLAEVLLPLKELNSAKEIVSAFTNGANRKASAESASKVASFMGIGALTVRAKAKRNRERVCIKPSN